MIDERRYNAAGQLVTTSEATIKVAAGGKNYYTVADGNGPVNALDHALRQALIENYPEPRADAADRLQGAHPRARAAARPP